MDAELTLLTAFFLMVEMFASSRQTDSITRTAIERRDEHESTTSNESRLCWK